MIRNVKALGLVVVVALAACAATASADPTAHKFTAQSYPATIHGTDERDATTIVTEAGAVNCEVKVHGQLTEPSQTLTLTPTYSKCTFGIFAATVETDGCDHAYRITTEQGPDTYQAHMDIECPSEKAITVTALSCKFEIPAQQGLTIVDFVNEKGGLVPDIKMKDTVKKVTYNVTLDGLGCPFRGVGMKSDGEFVSHEPMTLTAEGKWFDIG